MMTSRSAGDRGSRQRMHPRVRVLLTVVTISLAVILWAVVYTSLSRAHRDERIAQYDTHIASAVRLVLIAPAPSEASTTPAMSESTVSPRRSQPWVTEAVTGLPGISFYKDTGSDANLPLDRVYEQAFHEVGRISTIVVEGKPLMYDPGLLRGFLRSPDKYDSRLAQFPTLSNGPQDGTREIYIALFTPEGCGEAMALEHIADFILAASSPENVPALARLRDALDAGLCKNRYIESRDAPLATGKASELMDGQGHLRSYGVPGSEITFFLAARSAALTKRGRFAEGLEAILTGYDFTKTMAPALNLDAQQWRMSTQEYTDQALWYLVDKTDLNEAQIEQIRKRMQQRASAEPVARALETKGAVYERLGTEAIGNAWKANSFGESSPLEVARALAASLRDSPRKAMAQIMERPANSEGPMIQSSPTRDGFSDWWYSEPVVEFRAGLIGEESVYRGRDRAMLEHQWNPTLYARRTMSGAISSIAALGREIAVAEAFETALVLKRWRREHGSYPPSLDSLVPAQIKAIPRDAVFGEPLQYEITPNGYVISLPAKLAGKINYRSELPDVVWQSRLGEGRREKP